MSKGIVVDHKETGIRHAISESNFNQKVHKYVRDLNPGETVLGFTPKAKGTKGAENSPAGDSEATADTRTAEQKDADEQFALARADTKPTKTEGSSTEGTKEHK